MVRRSAATNLGKYAATVESPHLKTDIMSFFEDLTHDGIIFSYNTPRQ
jgi:serine/threonine-protein phosphatase 2A regulatory subunit A